MTEWKKRTEEELGRMDTFCEIIEALRAQDGCPWDREQTFESLKRCLISETTEVIAAADIYRETQDASNLCEELGDVLFQVVLQAQIADELGLFSMEDVIRGISQKMIRRHPHVFRRMDLERESVPTLWSEIKKAEKQKISPEMQLRQKQATADAASQVIAAVHELQQTIAHVDKKKGNP